MNMKEKQSIIASRTINSFFYFISIFIFISISIFVSIFIIIIIFIIFAVVSEHHRKQMACRDQ